VDPKVIISDHTVNAVVSIHIEDHGAVMTYLSADNVSHMLSYEPQGDGTYLMHSFLSYTNKPRRFGEILVDRDFNVINKFVNFTEYIVSGRAAKVKDGYIFTTASRLVKLDNDFNMMWGKMLPDRYFVNKIYGHHDGVSDGLILYLRKREQSHACFIKFGLDGTEIWRSDNLIPEGYISMGMKFGDINHGKIDFGTLLTISQQPDENFLLLGSFNMETGEVNNVRWQDGLTDIQTLQQILTDNVGQIFTVFNSGNDISGFVDINGRHDCTTSRPINLGTMPEISFLNTQEIFTSVDDNFTKGRVILTTTKAHTEVEAFCNIDIPDILPETDTICDGESLTLDVSAIPHKIIWEDNSSLKVRTINKPGYYSFRIDHCDIDHYESIHVIDGQCGSVYAPNIFNPNGDKTNNLFKLIASSDVSVNAVKIYNRWGSKVFECQGNDCVWDGTFNVQLVSTGVYTVMYEYTNLMGSKTGASDLTLLR
jgi:gliding motility-associated-like protein